MNRTHKISMLVIFAAAAALPLSFGQVSQRPLSIEAAAAPAVVPAGYAVAYLANGQPVLIPAEYAATKAPGAAAGYSVQPVTAPAAYNPAPMTPTPSPYPGPPVYVGQGAGLYNQQARRIVLPAGTTLFVRTGQALHSNNLQPGQVFDCFLDSPWYQGEVMIADRGARIEARVVESQLAGRISGQSQLALQLYRMQTADGKTIDIRTTTVSMGGGTSYGKDVARIATGAAIGAVMGGLAGGGKGAAIGSAVGAGGGTAWTLKTRGPEVAIPCETLLQFQLVSPVTFVTW